jgi:hypothetical protein
MDLEELGTYWLHKLPNVSFRETLQSCIERHPCGILPAHGTFLYPKTYGYGEVWRRMGKFLGDSLVTACPVKSIDLTTLTVNSMWRAGTIINTIPWVLWPNFCQVPVNIRAGMAMLQHAAINIDYVGNNLSSPSHWIYEPDESIPHHRLLLRSNFCQGSCGYWTETNAKRSPLASGWRYHNAFAYPINTRGKPEAVAKISEWALSHGIVGIGRWGKWEHMNSDVAVAEALAAGMKLSAGMSPT